MGCRKSLPANTESGTYTAEDLSKLLNCTVQHIRNMDMKDAIPGRIKFGRLVRWSKQAVDNWLATRKGLKGTASLSILSTITDNDFKEVIDQPIFWFYVFLEGLDLKQQEIAAGAQKHLSRLGFSVQHQPVSSSPSTPGADIRTNHKPNRSARDA